ncbi:hypothetical protein ES708_15636 [subsurface metagenome]
MAVSISDTSISLARGTSKLLSPFKNSPEEPESFGRNPCFPEVALLIVISVNGPNVSLAIPVVETNSTSPEDESTLNNLFAASM